MFSKHEFWKFFYDSAIILSVENEMMNYKINPSMHFLNWEHVMNVQLAYIQYCEDMKNVWITLCSVYQTQLIKNNFFFNEDSSLSM